MISLDAEVIQIKPDLNLFISVLYLEYNQCEFENRKASINNPTVSNDVLGTINLQTMLFVCKQDKRQDYCQFTGTHCIDLGSCLASLRPSLFPGGIATMDRLLRQAQLPWVKEISVFNKWKLRK